MGLFFFVFSSAQITGKVVKVSDGDTFHLLTTEKKLYKIRIADIDAPERGQAFGKQAKEFTFSEIFGKIAEVKKTNNDRYGRTVGCVYYNQNKDLAEELLKAGLAWVWRFSKNERYKQLETQAKESGKGLWSDKDAMDPYQWRKSGKRKKADF